MSDAFDPYYTWLSIPPAEQPPNHYRLLGLPLYEANADVIANAADRQMAHLRSAAAGKHAALSQKLLNEVATAQVCLLDAKRKPAYDAELKKRLAPPESDDRELNVVDDLPPMRPGSIAAGPAPMLRPRTASPARRRKSSLNLPVVLGIGAAVVVVIAIAVISLGDFGDSGSVATGDGNSGTKPTPRSGPKKPVEPDTNPIRQSDANDQPPPLAPIENPPAAPPGENETTTPPMPTGESPVTPADSPGESESPAMPPMTTPPEGENSPKPESPDKGVTASPEVTPMPRSVEPVPDEAAIAAAEKEIRAVYREELANKSPDVAEQLAKKLLESARERKETAINRFVMARLASDVAAGLQDIPAAFAAIDLLGEQFEIKALDLKRQAITKASKAATTPETLKKFLTASIDTCRQAVAADDFPLAKAALDAFSPASRRANDRFVTAEVARLTRDLPRLEREFAKVNASLAKLGENADDPEANLHVGRYQCFLKGDWDKGLPHLAKSSDAKLKSLAEEDIKAAQGAADVKADVAEGWWTLAEKAPAVDKQAIQRRAAWWYQQTLPELTGLARTKAQQRLKQVGIVEPPGLADAMIGYWRLDDGGAVLRDTVGQRHGSAKNVTWVREGTRPVLQHSSKSVVEFPPIDFGETFTIALWAKPANGSKNIKTLVSTRASGGKTDGRGFTLFINSWNTADRCLLIESIDKGTVYTSTPKDTATLGTWMHVAFTANCSTGNAMIFVNGKAASGSGNFPKTIEFDKVWRVGSFLSGGATHPFDGPLSDLRVYGRELTPDEILFLATIAGL